MPWPSSFPLWSRPHAASRQQLVELLKLPACVGEFRLGVLDQLSHCYQRQFADQWEFVRFARQQGLGLDFTTPPQRSEEAKIAGMQ